MADKNLEILIDIKSKLEGLLAAEKGLSDLNSQVKTSEKTLGSFESKMEAVGKAGLALAAGAGAITAAFGLIGKAAIGNAADLEQQRVAFKGILGSYEQADKILNRIAKVAAATPFEQAGLTALTAQLTTITKDGNKAIDILTSVGDAVAKSGKGINELDRVVLNLQQIASTGKITATDIKQFQAAIPLFNDILAASDLTVEKLQNSKNAADLLFKAFAKASAQGGITFGGLNEQSLTLNGLISTLKDNFNLFATRIGKALLPVSKKLVAIFIQVTDVLNNLNPNIIKIITAFGAAVAVVASILAVFGAVAAAVPVVVAGIGAITTAMGFLGISIGVATGGLSILVVALTAAFAFLIFKFGALGDEVANVKKEFTFLDKILSAVFLVIQKVANFIGTVLVTAFDVWIGIVKSIYIVLSTFFTIIFNGIAALVKFILNLDLIKSALTAIYNIGKATYDFFIKLFQLIGNFFKELPALVDGVINKIAEKIPVLKTLLPKKIEAPKVEGTTAPEEEDPVARAKRLAALKQKAEQEALIQSKENLKKYLDETKDLEENQTIETVTAKQQADQAEYERQVANLTALREFKRQNGTLTAADEIAIQEEITAIDKSYKDKQYANAVQLSNQKNQLQVRDLATLKKFLGDIAVISKDAAETLKAIRTGEAIINTAAAIASALTGPFPINLINAAIIAARGAATIATIQAQSFAVGTTNVPQDQLANIHAGEMIIPKTFAEGVRSGEVSLGGGQPTQNIVNNNFSFNGDLVGVISDEIVEKIENKINERTQLSIGGILATAG